MERSGVILLIAFVGLAVFGMFGMHAGTHDHDGGCIAAVLRGTDCPDTLLRGMNFHVGTFKEISSALPSGSIVLTLLALMLALGASLVRAFAPPVLVRSGEVRRMAHLSGVERRSHIHWLALLELSPSLLRTRA